MLRIARGPSPKVRPKTQPENTVFRRQLRDLIRHFDTNPVATSVLYFGDSVLSRVSRDDHDTRSLGQMVAEKLGDRMQVVCIYDGAYHMAVFNAFVRALGRMRYRPQVIVLPVNLRSFSPQWHLNPEWQFDKEIRTLEEFTAGRTQTVPPVQKLPQSIIEFRATPVEYPCSSLTRIGEFLDVVRMRTETAEQKEYRWGQIHVFHYMHPLQADHPKLLLVKETLEEIEKLGAFAVAYVTPINHQAGRKLIGEDFASAVRDQVELVRRQVAESERRGRARFLDCSTMFGSDCFFHEYDPTEHLNERGRLMLADVIAQVILQLCQ